jgi:hypothetical protein
LVGAPQLETLPLHTTPSPVRGVRPRAAFDWTYDKQTVIIIAITIMGLVSVSATEDVIGDLPSPMATISL